ncbi:hypothetical protein PHSY_004531 [Pseudozyma hubeiensis SY62]|uniref:Uncharacterized protein n=1 Tax=Pseudozyma hubeiensis (strain SY62) TaxID=1305764 RepID=R9P6T2_PSEHS|nr:hypothetical protein PHSY_004531 [Pseudozyma hubeiensis SY62]GAC96947.1 hypothetical protein PHSY_004531 [Pseudozyma hubeiensis SY62]
MVPLNPPVPRACFETPWHIASALRDPRPTTLSGFIDATGKRLMLRPDAVVTLHNLEIHVEHQKEKPLKEEDKSCVDVLAYRLPGREIQVRENWCPGQFRSIVL